jgi:uncharacterized protein YkwD
MRQPPTQIRFLALVACVCAAALASPSSALAARACESANATPAHASTRVVVRATVCLLNAERARFGLHPLRLNKQLSSAARRHSHDMARRKYFLHDTLGGGSFLDRIQRTGYLRGARRWTVAENLAWATLAKAAPRGVTAMWMNSPGHRANILYPSFREVGIGVAGGAPIRGISSPGATYTTDFGVKS